MKEINYKTRFFIITVIITTLTFVLCTSVMEASGIMKYGFIELLKELPFAILLFAASFYLFMYSVYLIAYCAIYMKNNEKAEQFNDNVARWKRFNSPFISMMLLIFISCISVIGTIIAVSERKSKLSIEGFSSLAGLIILIIATLIVIYSMKRIGVSSSSFGQVKRVSLKNTFNKKVYRYLRGAAFLILSLLIVENIILAAMLIAGKFNDNLPWLNMLSMGIFIAVIYIIMYCLLNRKIKRSSNE